MKLRKNTNFNQDRGLWDKILTQELNHDVQCERILNSWDTKEIRNKVRKCMHSDIRVTWVARNSSGNHGNQGILGILYLFTSKHSNTKMSSCKVPIIVQF
jgi:hypothetical protein